MIRRGRGWIVWLGFLGGVGIWLMAVSPAGAQKKDIQAGKAKYQQLCVSCHGINGKGNGPVAANLPVKPTDYTDPKIMGSLKDEEMFTAIKMGGPAVKKSPTMPPWENQLSDTDIRNIIAYIRTLAQPPKK